MEAKKMEETSQFKRRTRINAKRNSKGEVQIDVTLEDYDKTNEQMKDELFRLFDMCEGEARKRMVEVNKNANI